MRLCKYSLPLPLSLSLSLSLSLQSYLAAESEHLMAQGVIVQLPSEEEAQLCDQGNHTEYKISEYATFYYIRYLLAHSPTHPLTPCLPSSLQCMFSPVRELSLPSSGSASPSEHWTHLLQVHVHVHVHVHAATAGLLLDSLSFQEF